VRLLVDMNLSPAWVTYLAAAGHEAEHWATIGPTGAADSTLMAYARERGSVVLTHDLDFGAILAATGGRKPSVVQIRADRLSPTMIGPQVVSALRQLEPELAAGALLSVDPGRTRVSLLPLPGPR
jgi:predicted nuclease of predicted toxin-antitoxin system